MKDKVRDKESPLKFETVKLLEQSISFNHDLKEELELLKTVNIDGIITTNWDDFLESVFEDFSVYVGQSELLFSNEFNVGNIFKIHGSINKPNSIVLTQQDYESFRRKNEYLAAKLLTLFVEQPIIFLGYSLQDPNIQSVLKSIINCLDDNNIAKLNGRFIFCEWVEGLETPTFQNGTIVIQGARNNDVLPIKHLRMNSFIPLYEVLSSTKDRLPVKVLRNMQNMVFDFVKQTEPRDNVYVLAENLEELDNQDVQFVYGLSITDKISEKGIVGLKQKDLLKDIIIHNGYNSNDICEHLLPVINAKYVPYHFYLRNAGYLNDDGSFNDDSERLDDNLIEYVENITRTDFYPQETYARKEGEVNENYDNLEELIDGEDDFHAFLYIPLLDIDKLDLDLLQQFIQDKLTDDNLNSTHFKKLICYYDLLTYKNA